MLATFLQTVTYQEAFGTAAQINMHLLLKHHSISTRTCKLISTVTQNPKQTKTLKRRIIEIIKKNEKKNQQQQQIYFLTDRLTV